MYRPAKFIISDMDGTIFDSDWMMVDTHGRVLKEYGKNLTEELYAKVKGKTEKDIARFFIDELSLPITEKEYFEHHLSHCTKILPTTKLLPGVESVFSHLNNSGIKMAVATSAPSEFIDLEFKKYPGLKKYFRHFVSANDDPLVKNGKPAPDVYLEAARRFHPSADPKDCLVFEDSPNGVKAGLAAGMQVIMVNKPEIIKPFKGVATQVITSFKQFKPIYYGLPSFCENCSCNNKSC